MMLYKYVRVKSSGLYIGSGLYMCAVASTYRAVASIRVKSSGHWRAVASGSTRKNAGEYVHNNDS